MIIARRMLILLAGAGLLGRGQLSAAEPIPPQDFARLHALIKPGAGEDRWTRIPWLASLWEARRRAAAEGKPILLWEMDGNPLGCT
jgi:hypothetical protein